MDYSYIDVRDALLSYFSGEVTREDIAEWGRNAESDFLDGGFLSADKLTAYPFLNELARADIAADDKNDVFPPTDEELEYYCRILYGEEKKSFFVRMTVPWELMRRRIRGARLSQYDDIFSRYSELKEILLKTADGSVTDKDIYWCGRLLHGNNESKTVLGILELKVSSLFGRILPLNNDAGSFSRVTELFPNENSARSEESLVGLLSAYIDCILGDRCFIAEIRFADGKAELDIFPDAVWSA